MSETALAMVQTTPGASALVQQDQRWAVLVTYPQAEEWAQANLALRGYKPYLPLYAVRVRHPRLRWLGQILHRPLFPGYIFCPHNPADPWRPIRYCPGIRANPSEASECSMLVRPMWRRYRPLSPSAALRCHQEPNGPQATLVASPRGCLRANPPPSPPSRTKLPR